jgi:hypothetical protein
VFLTPEQIEALTDAKRKDQQGYGPRRNLAVNPAAYLFLKTDTNNFDINKATNLPVDYWTAVGK